MHSKSGGSHREWTEYCKSGKRPSDIPAKSNQVYRDVGWVCLGGVQRKKTGIENGNKPNGY